MYLIIPALILLILTFLSAYFSSSETALFSLSSMKIKAYQTSPDSRRRLIAKLLSQPRDLLVTVFMWNTIVNILLQNVASHIFGQFAGWSLKVGVPFVVTLVFGEIIPKYVGLQNNIRLSYYVINSINFLQNIISPIRKATIAITTPLSHYLFFFLKKDKTISKEELEFTLKTSEKHGVLHPEETELVRGYLHLQNVTIKEIMRPKEDLLFYSLDEPFKKLIHLFVDLECSRVPVCDKNLRNIHGIISAKTFFLIQDLLNEPKDLLPHLTKPYFIPETASAKTLGQQHEQVMALVVDEYGSVSGLVTREDFYETVVGEITDRRDVKSFYTKQGKNEIIASGKLELTDLNQLFDVNLTSPTNMVTIGGWLTEQMGTIPKSGTTYETDDFLFQVLSSEPNRIKRLYIRKIMRRGKKHD